MEKTQYRIDHSPIRKHYSSPDGYLYAEATFARDGILEYTNADGSKRRELRLPEENKKALTGFGRKPFTIEHPPVLVNASNSKQLSVGLTDPEVVYDKSGFIRGVITVTDSLAVDLIKTGQKPEVSVGYQCRLERTPGIWNGEHYDAIQRDILVNHVCCTSKGRAGGDVRIHLDSEAEDSLDIAYLTDSLDFNNTTTGGNVATLTIGSATYDAPAELASAISSELSRLDSASAELERLRSENRELKADVKDSQGRIDSLSEELASTIDRADTQEGRADRFEEIVDDSIALLSEEGYKWNADSARFIRTDGKNMMKEDEEDEDEEMPASYKGKKDMKGKKGMIMKSEDTEEDYEDEEVPASYKGKKDMKGKKGMIMKPEDTEEDYEDEEEEVKKDSVEEIVTAALEAEALCPGIRQDADFASSSVRSIQELVISRLDSGIDLSSSGDGFVAGVYYALTEQAKQTNTVGHSYAQDAMNAVTTSAGQPRHDAVEVFAGASGARMAEAWKSPLS